jgi:hypothetical protein
METGMVRPPPFGDSEWDITVPRPQCLNGQGSGAVNRWW